MTSFTGSVITVLLGWVKGIFAWFWQMVGSFDQAQTFRWFADHWILLAAVLCVLCAAVDWIVYLLRWRPADVWKSYFRRLRRSGAEPEPAAEPPATSEGPVMIYADGRTEQVTETPSAPQSDPSVDEVPEPAEARPASPIRFTRRSDRYKQGPVSALQERFRQAALDQVDEDTRIATYKPVMTTDPAKAFHQPVYPDRHEHPSPGPDE